MRPGLARLTRWLLVAAGACLAAAVLLLVVGLLADDALPRLWRKGVGVFAVLGMGGFLASLALAGRVRCQACGQQAMVFPDHDPREPGFMRQPWRRYCCRCGAALRPFPH